VPTSSSTFIEASLAGISWAVAPVGIRNTEADAAGANLIEMAVGPAHGSLDGQMGERDRAIAESW
jgi:hypothetical protein